MLAEEKIAGGKLVCIQVEAEGGSVSHARISGDFFLHPEERIESLERALSGVPLAAGESEITAILEGALGDGILIGATCADLARLFKRAVRG